MRPTVANIARFLIREKAEDDSKCSSRIAAAAEVENKRDHCALVTRTFCERSVKEFDSVKQSHFHIEMY